MKEEKEKLNEQEETLTAEQADKKEEKSKGKGKKADKKDKGPSEEEKLRKELEEQKDKYIRLYSEFENFRRRTSKEKLEMATTANASLMESLLPVLDDFERAQKNITDDSDIATVREGVELIQNKMLNILSQKGLKMMEVAPGDSFDADKHEAITQIPAPQEELKGKIVDVVEKGYTLGDKVVRFAKVVTGA